MSIRSREASVGFDWLTRGIGAGFRHPKPLFTGAAILALASLLPSLITMPIQFHAARTGTPLNLATYGWLTAGSMLLSLLLVPLNAGYLQVVDAAERGLPARARDIFNPYRHGDALRLIGYGLAMVALYIVMFGIIIVAAGSGIAGWYVSVLAAQASHQPPPGLPHGFGIAMALFTVLGLFMMGLYAISLGQVALKRRAVFGAIGDGLLGALKNLLPLLVFAVSFAIVCIVAAIALTILILLLVLLFILLAKLAGAWLAVGLGVVLGVPLYIAMLLVMVSMMYGVMHALWRDVCDDDVGPGVTPVLAA